MTRLWAIAVIALRNAIRSRVVLTLLVFLALVVIGLPLTIVGDGTLEGRVRIMLRYTLAGITLVLSIASIWGGCAALSSEIQQGQIRLTAVKPIRRAQIWIGKWLGLLIVNFLLLLVGGAAIYAQLCWSLRPSVLAVAERHKIWDEMLAARQPVRPVPDDVEAEARAQARARISQAGLPPNTTEEQVVKAYRRQLLIRSHRLQPGQGRRWTFRLDRPQPADRPLLIRYTFSASALGPVAVPGRWTLTDPAGAVLFETSVTHVARRPFTLVVPGALVKDQTRLTLAYRNLSTDKTTVLFDPDEGLRLLVYRGAFLPNYLRGLALIFFTLALLSAAGLTAGALFSMPVAALVSLYLILLVQASDYIQRTAAQSSILTFSGGKPPAWLEAIFEIIFKTLGQLVRPLKGFDVAGALVQGLHLDWSRVGIALLVRGLLYSGVLALAGIAALSRRELALPSRGG